MPVDSRPLDLAELERTTLEAALVERGHERFRAGQVFRWIYRRGVTEAGAMTDLSRELRATLTTEFTLATPTLTATTGSTEESTPTATATGSETEEPTTTASATGSDEPTVTETPTDGATIPPEPTPSASPTTAPGVSVYLPLAYR